MPEYSDRRRIIMYSYIIYIASLLSVLLSTPEQAVYLRNIYSDVFDCYYLLHFQDSDSATFLVLSKKGNIILEPEKAVKYDSLIIGHTYNLLLHKIDSIPSSLKPVSSFNLRGIPATMFYVGDIEDVEAGTGILLYSNNKFVVNLYSVPNIVGLYIKEGNIRRK
jgi:hypothetical protein